MKPMQRLRTADRVVDYFKQQLASGALGAEIPSCRQLAAQLEVSPPTVLQALATLVSEGWLEPGGARRPYRVVQTQGAGAGDPHRLLLLSPQPLSSCDSYTRGLLEQMIIKCTAEGWEIQTRILDYRNRRYPARKWDELVRSHRPTRLVVVTGTPAVARWAGRLAIPTFFLGGSPGETGVTTVGVSLSALVRVLLRRLPAAECLHFCLPICGDPEEFATAIHQACREELESRGIPFVPGYHAPFRAAGGPAEVRAAVAPVLARQLPKCFIFKDLADYLAVLGMLTECYRHPAAQPNLVFLTHDVALDWMDPAPACFVYPHAKIWRLIKSWLANPNGSRFNRGNIMLEGIYRPGGGCPEAKG